MTTTTDLNKYVANLRKAHAKLADLLIEDERKALRMEGLTFKLETALKATNDDALESVSNRSVIPSPTAESGFASTAHPLLAILKILPADKTALEYFNENIQCSQTKNDTTTLVHTKGQ